jgi:hypothetical protein
VIAIYTLGDMLSEKDEYVIVEPWRLTYNVKPFSSTRLSGSDVSNAAPEARPVIA